MMIIGTTSSKDVMQHTGIVDCFNICYNVPNIVSKEEVSVVLQNFSNDQTVIDQISQEVESVHSVSGLPIKNLMLAIDLAIEKNGNGLLEFNTFMEQLDSIYN